MSITIYGASDDLIECEGDIREEWTASGDGDYIATDTGALLRITYDGMWTIRVITGGISGTRLVQATDEDTDYSDKATIEGVSWVVVGTCARRTPERTSE